MTPTTVAEVINQERDSLAIETRTAHCPPLVAVNSMDEVARVPSSLRWNHPATVSSLPSAKGSAFVVETPSLQSKILWVATQNNSYRDDYLTYLTASHGFQLSALPAGYDVDHLYNRSRAQQYGLQFIRVALVSHAVNRSHGAAYEKDLTRNEAARERNHLKLMDEITSMKYFGFLSPLRNDPREDEIAAYCTFAAAKLGLDPKSIRESIAYLRTKASTPWAVKK